MKINVAVFFGCSSVEHEVSVISGVQAMHALDREKYHVIPVYVTKERVMVTGDRLLDMSSYQDLPGLLAACTPVLFYNDGKQVLMRENKTGLFKKPVETRIDFALPVVHGTNCEDGSLQGWFEILGLPYAGCDVVSSAAGMDKALFKRAVSEADVPVLPGVTVTVKEWLTARDAVFARVAALHYPVIVKPVNLGSSVGITKVKTPEDLAQAMDLAFSFAQVLLIEHAVTNLREINCSVVGDAAECRASACEEPVAQDEILSYQDKYQSGGAKGSKTGGSKGMSSLQRKLPAELSPEKTQEIQALACKTFRALGCCGVVRIDFLMDGDDGDKVYVNEINTIPGSLAFYLWEAVDVPYAALLDQIIQLGFKRVRTRGNLMFTIQTNLLSSNGLVGMKGAKGAK